MSSKHWLLLGSVAFGVGFGLSLPFNRDIKQAALIGLTAIPAATAGALVVTHQQKRSLGTVFSSLHEDIQALEQQKSRLLKATHEGTAKKQQVQVQLDELQSQLTQLEAELSTQREQKQSLEHTITLLETQKQQLEDDGDRIQKKIQETQEHEQRLNEDLSTIAAEKEELQNSFTTLNAELARLQNDIAEHTSQQQTLNQLVITLEDQKKQLETEVAILNEQIQVKEQQETSLNRILTRITNEKQQQENELATLQSELTNLKNQIQTQQQQKTDLEQGISHLQANQQSQEALLTNFRLESEQLQSSIANQEHRREQLNQELSELLAQKDSLEQELQQLQLLLQVEPSQTTETSEAVADVGSSIDDASEVEHGGGIEGSSVQPTTAQSSSDLFLQGEKAADRQPQATALKRSNMPSMSSRILTTASLMTSGDYNFARPDHARHLWEDRLLPYWAHYSRPRGKRFLGSFKIQQDATDYILEIIQRNLKRLDRLTFGELCERFDEVDQNQYWVRILTFAFSEYAYYYSRDRFWQGFCEKLDLPHNQYVENTFRQVVDEGIDILGLVRAKGGYRYVSTLWLQSGIPEQNLEHFSQLVQELADEYGWWELAHADTDDLAQELLNFCQNKHPQWGTLMNFLKISCPGDERTDALTEVDPISGRLVQGIAIVAQELERQGLSPEALQDDNQREELLRSYCLPENFFLRSWNALMEVLTPKDRSSSNRRISHRRKRSLFLELDLSSLDTHLVLPQQTLWQHSWRNLRGTFCQIPEAEWESIIPEAGDLEIPELLTSVNTPQEQWIYRLQNHNRVDLLQWQMDGIAPELPFLVFDAITGEHIPLGSSNFAITGRSEIICFTPKELQLEFGDGVEIVDTRVPSSIRGWRGQQIELTIPSSAIQLKRAPDETLHLIPWQTAVDQPTLQGLRLRGKKSIYLNAPTFWFPPPTQNVSLNLLIEDVTKQDIAGKSLETVPASNKWHPIPLKQWITDPGIYEVRFWNETHRWTYRFEIQTPFQHTSLPQLAALQVIHNSQDCTNSLPLRVDTAEQFWSEILQIKGLWALETLALLLSNGQDEVPYPAQSDTNGNLEIRLSGLYDLLPASEQYTLSYQRVGSESQLLIEMKPESQDLGWRWNDQGVEISGLKAGQPYSLCCWNILLPQSRPVQVEIIAGAVTQVPLSPPPGIYHVELSKAQQLIKSLGWWCSSDRNAIPDEATQNEALENYCYTILGNEPVEDFLAATNQLQLDLSCVQLESLITDLQVSYHFPAWLNQSLLLAKLQALLKDLRDRSAVAQTLLTKEQTKPSKMTSQSTTSASADDDFSTGKWHLAVVAAWKRDFFCNQLENFLRQNASHSGITRFEKCVGSDFESYVLIQAQNLAQARTSLRQIPYFQDIQRQPLKPHEVRRMLGR